MSQLSTLMKENLMACGGDTGKKCEVEEVDEEDSNIVCDPITHECWRVENK